MLSAPGRVPAIPARTEDKGLRSAGPSPGQSGSTAEPGSRPKGSGPGACRPCGAAVPAEARSPETGDASPGPTGASGADAAPVRMERTPSRDREEPASPERSEPGPGIVSPGLTPPSSTHPESAVTRIPNTAPAGEILPISSKTVSLPSSVIGHLTRHGRSRTAPSIGLDESQSAAPPRAVGHGGAGAPPPGPGGTRRDRPGGAARGRGGGAAPRLARQWVTRRARRGGASRGRCRALQISR